MQLEHDASGGEHNLLKTASLDKVNPPPISN